MESHGPPPPAPATPAGLTLRRTHRALLVLAGITLVLAPVPMYLPYLGGFALLLIALAGLLFWASLACVLPLANAAPGRNWLARDGFPAFLALLGSTLCSSAFAATGFMTIASFVALALLLQSFVLAHRSSRPAAFAQVAALLLGLIAIPLTVKAKTPGAGEATVRTNAALGGWLGRSLRGPDAQTLRAQRQKDLVVAARLGRLQDLKALLAQGADPNEHDALGVTALSVAKPRAAELLLRFKADPNHRDALGRTAFLAGLHEGDPQTLKLLAAQGADVRARDAAGRTALLTLVEWGSGGFRLGSRSYRLAEWLLAQGVDREARTSDADRDFPSMNAIEIASKLGLSQLQALLEGHPCPDLFGLPEGQVELPEGVDQRAAILAREPTEEHRLDLYRALGKNVVTVDGAEKTTEGALASLYGPVPVVRGEEGALLLAFYGGRRSGLPPSFRSFDTPPLLDLAAGHRAGLLVRSGFGPDDPAVVVPAADIDLIRRCRK